MSRIIQPIGDRIIIPKLKKKSSRKMWMGLEDHFPPVKTYPKLSKKSILSPGSSGGSASESDSYTFPQNGILDNFNRANESPLSGGGNWLHPFNPHQAVHIDLINTSEIHSILDDMCSFYWATSFGAEQECYITFNHIETVTPGYFDLTLKIANPNLDTLTAYYLDIDFTTSPDTWQFGRFTDHDSYENVGSSFTQNISEGDSIGACYRGGKLYAYYKAGAGAWTEKTGGGIADVNLQSQQGYIGIYVDRTDTYLDNFGGGTIV